MEEKYFYSLVMTSEAISMGNLSAEQATPATANPTVRTREYLTQREIDKLMDAARSGSRYGHRDSTMILIAYRHGLRASELCDLQWSQEGTRGWRIAKEKSRHRIDVIVALGMATLAAVSGVRMQPNPPIVMTTWDGDVIWTSKRKPDSNIANPQSAPCTIDFKKLEPKPLPEGFKRIKGPVRFW
jgi:hypothetical protein